MDIRSLFAAQSYASTQAATQAQPVQGPSKLIEQGMVNFEQAMSLADTTSQSALVGRVDPHALVHALAQSQLAVETVVTVRNKVVEAYQEILRMPV